MEQFGILIDDGAIKVPQYVIKQNTDRVELYDWQQRAIEYFFNNDTTAIFEVTTGAGKTYCAIQILKEIWKQDPEVKTLIVVPKNVILEDTWFKELYDAGISLREIGVYYGNIKEYGKVTITNMQSIHKIALELFDCIIFDEVHNYGTERLLPYLGREVKYKLGLSATVERMDEAHWDIMKLFNYNMFRYTPQEALKDGVLNPFNFVNISVDLDDEDFDTYERLTKEITIICQSGGGFKRVMRGAGGLKFKLMSVLNERKSLVNNYYKKFDVVKMIVDKHREDKIILFNEYNDTTNKSYWYLLDIGVKACRVHSDVPTEKREENMMGFRTDKYNVMLASRVLDEGYNLPKLDVAIIAAGNSTSKQTIQRMGRVLRKKNKRSMLYQIYCRGTVEETQGIARSVLFRELCSDYDEAHYDGTTPIELKEMEC